MFIRFPHLCLIRKSVCRRMPQSRRALPRGRRRVLLAGRIEHLEGRALMSFGDGGIVTTQVGTAATQAFAIAVQPADQKIVAAGDAQTAGSGGAASFVVVRYNTDGTLDSKFGTNGVATTSFGKSDFDQINSILLQPNDGEIVAGGTDVFFDKKTVSYQAQLALARYTTSGTLDTNFGSGGKVTTAFPSNDGEVQIDNVLLRSDGEIVAVGVVAGKVALALYKSNGALDTSFGSSGTLVDSSLSTSTSSPNSYGGTTTVTTSFRNPAGGALESNNSILVAGACTIETKITE